MYPQSILDRNIIESLEPSEAQPWSPPGRDFNGQTPLDRASENGHEATVRLLIEKGAQPRKGYVEINAHIEHQSVSDPLQVDTEDIVTEERCELESSASPDNATEYSDAGSLETREELYSSALARKILNDVGVFEVSAEISAKLTRILPELLKNFALDVSHASKDQLCHDIMFHVHKRRE
jgi:hypothetical protein